MKSKEIRSAFLDFFESKQHKIVPSSPLVNKNDPTLMFTNSGMVQFKDFFLGNKKIVNKRVADTQKCLRVSGKHNDLEDVGMDGTHHTLFEMLGNWSFGDYFKEEAIAWSWELLTDVYKLPKDKLYATVFGGDNSEYLDSDEEAKKIWLKYLPESHILYGNKKDNFWEMGEMGPCGPCSEIHIDLRSDDDIARIPGNELVNKDHPQVVEIWNNVFMQFNRKADKSLEPLPAKHVDTGMGFERLCMTIQGKKYTYDTDVFTPLIQFIEKETNVNYKGSYERSAKQDIAIRVVADHIRAVAFTIADGELPSNNGAGYVVRRILRRAVRYYYSFLNRETPLLYKLVPLLASEFEFVFPELIAQQDFVQKVILEEEKSFLRTLEGGLKRFDSLVPVNGVISGVEAFELLDTYGFPIDLTELIAAEKGWTINKEAFNQALNEQKERSKADAKKTTGDWIITSDIPTSTFDGYDHLVLENVKIIKYRTVQAKGQNQFQLVLDRTPFYAQSGGQAGDKGTLIIDNESIDVIDTQKENDLTIHVVDKFPSNFEGNIKAIVNETLRLSTSNHHTAVHLMHAALHEVVGKHALQKGQDVDANRLRFDFSHFQKVTDEEIQKIEKIVNEKIRANIPLLEQRNVPIEEARKTGAMMLFGEKYGDSVRIITFDPNFSVELCGGTHAKATGQLGYFKILTESAVAAGVRRIEAIVADAAENYINTELLELNNIREIVKSPKNASKAILTLQEENKKLQKELEKLIDNQAIQLANDLEKDVKQVNGIHFLQKTLPISDPKAIKTIAFNLEKKFGNAVFGFGNIANDKPMITVIISENLCKEKGWNAGQFVREMAKEIQGGGGGQAGFATAGGQNVAGLSNSLAVLEKLIA